MKNSINLIKKEELYTVYNNISKVFNRYLKPEVIPNEMTISRLRPIAISSTLIKMIESAIYTRLLDEINEKKLICNKQIGFIKGCGTELNLLRLKQRINEVKKERNMFNKYLVFIDLKNAYDKVIKNYINME